MSSKSVTPKAFLINGLLALISTGALAQAPVTESVWSPLTSKETPVCSPESPCRIQNGSTTFSIEFTPEVFLFGDEPKQKLDSIKVKNISSANSTPQVFALEEMNYLSEKDHYKLFQVRFRPTGETDLAIRAYSSASEGPVYYYFLFDKRKNAFVMQQETFPQLRFDSKTRRYLTELQSTPYVLDSNLQFRPAGRRR